MREKKPMIILTGPTAVGKTELSIKLAKAVNGQIISADSMQVYKYMDIGSAKVTPEEMDGVKHYLIDALMPDEEFHIFRFQEMAKAALEQIYAEGCIPIIAGGTGFYIQGLLYDIAFEEQDADPKFRRQMEAFVNQNGAHELHEKLKDCDPVSYEAIHENNVKRVIRALEFYHLTGTPISAHNEKEHQKESPYNFAYFVLNDRREHLYERINRRVDLMMERGLLDEIKRLKEMGYTEDMVSMKGIGYKEMLRYLDGRYSLEHAIETVKQESRRFAKRQLTWFRREKDVCWVDKDRFDYDDKKILDYMMGILRDKGVIE